MYASTVFVVDDEAGFRGSLMRLLRSAGLTAREFASADEFLAPSPDAQSW